MRSSLAVISFVLSIFLLFSAGCEPEPQAPAPAPEQVQAETAVEQQPEQTQEQMEAARAEIEEMIQQTQQKQAAEQAKAETAIEEPVVPEPAPVETVTPEPALAETVIPEPEPVVPDEQAVPEALPQVEPEPEAPQTSPDDVIVTVNGIDIKRAKIDEMVNTRMDQVKTRRGIKLNEDHLKSMKDRLLIGAIEAAIIETLIDEKIKEHNLVISEQQIEEYVAWMAARQRMTVEDLKAIITSREQLTYEQWKEQMQFDKRIGVLKLTEIEGMGTPDINDADVLEFYEKNKARYETPEQVKASHILIKPDDSPTADPNTADADARAKAEELLAQIKDGADFAQLAMENSACPSSSKGGDLGFGQRRSWVKPFADAAFAMQPGEISDVVKTRFGYHIIKTTERKEADLTPLDEAKDDILMMLQGGREAELASKYVKSLRNAAEVVYAEGQQPDESELPVQ